MSFRTPKIPSFVMGLLIFRGTGIPIMSPCVSQGNFNDFRSFAWERTTLALCFPTFRAESCACPAVPCPALHCPALPRPAVPAKPRPSWSGGRKSPKSEELSSRHPIMVSAPPPLHKTGRLCAGFGGDPGGLATRDRAFPAFHYSRGAESRSLFFV